MMRIAVRMSSPMASDRGSGMAAETAVAGVQQAAAA
jgi:hypothetical protein